MIKAKIHKCDLCKETRTALFIDLNGSIIIICKSCICDIFAQYETREAQLKLFSRIRLQNNPVKEE